MSNNGNSYQQRGVLLDFGQVPWEKRIAAMSCLTISNVPWKKDKKKEYTACPTWPGSSPVRKTDNGMNHTSLSINAWSAVKNGQRQVLLDNGGQVLWKKDNGESYMNSSQVAVKKG